MKRIFAITAIALLSACSEASGPAPQAETQAAPADTEMAVSETSEAEDTRDNAAIVQGVYDGFADGDMAAVTANFAEDVVWNEAENSPYSDLNPYEGTEEIVTGLFARLGGEWVYFNAVPSDFVSERDQVVTIGRYTAKNKASGKEMDIPFVHVWTVEDGAITSFQQYTDTLGHTEVMTSDEE